MYTAVNQAFDAVLGRILPEYIKHTSVRMPSRFMHDFDAAIFYGAACHFWLLMSGIMYKVSTYGRLVACEERTFATELLQFTPRVMRIFFKMILLKMYLYK